MKQCRLAELLGITPKHLSDLKHGRKSTLPKMAEKMESATGISKFAWLYPGERFGDPWKQLKDIP